MFKKLKRNFANAYGNADNRPLHEINSSTGLVFIISSIGLFFAFSTCPPKLHRKTYKVRFIAKSSACTTAELTNLLTSCLTAVKTWS